MDFIRMRSHETRMSVELRADGHAVVVRRYRRGVLVREAVRGLVASLLSVVLIGAIASAVGGFLAALVVVVVVVVVGWMILAVGVIASAVRGGPVDEVAVLPSRWAALPVEAEADAIQWACVSEAEAVGRREANRPGQRAAARRAAEARVDLLIAEALARIPVATNSDKS